MIILQANNLTKRFNGSDLFNNVSLKIDDSSKIALVGRNGVGKTTLAKMLIGDTSIDEGKVSTNNDLTIGYLSQNTGLRSDKTIWEEMEAIFDYLKVMEKKLHHLEIQMSEPQVINDPEELKQVTNTYDNIQNDFTQKNGYGYKSEIRSVLHGFGFTPDTYDKNINELSGGQQTQLALAKLLLEKPKLLILDEPTNHLDVQTLTWLENYLQGYPGALLIISHDRYFMDKITNEVYDLDNGGINHYQGNYSTFVKERHARYVQQLQQYQKQQSKIKKDEEFIKKNIVRASTSKRAQSRRKQLEKVKRVQPPSGDSKVAHFKFSPDRQSGNVVLNAHDLAIGYDNNIVSAPINLNIKKYQYNAIIGPNGSGKSTLLKTIINQIPAIKGSINFGTGVSIGYYDQKQANLHENKTVLDELWDDYPTVDEGDIRSILGSFLFSGEEVQKIVHDLSGGERARLLLTKLAMDHDNFLLLDEPTNHLDIESREVLENAIKQFDGTILFVSHDRYFINRIASSIIEISPKGSELYLGNYDYYIEKKEEKIAMKKHKEAKEAESKKGNNLSNKSNQIENNNSNQNSAQKEYLNNKEYQKQERQLSRQVENTEEQLNQLAQQKSEIEKEMVAPDNLNNIKKLNELQDKLQDVNQKDEKLENEWENYAMQLEELDNKK